MRNLFYFLILSLSFCQLAFSQVNLKYQLLKSLRLKMTDDPTGMSTESQISKHVAIAPSGKFFIFPFQHMHGSKNDGYAFKSDVLVDIDKDTQTDLLNEDFCDFTTYTADGHRMCSGSSNSNHYKIFEKDQDGKVLNTLLDWDCCDHPPYYHTNNQNFWFIDRTAILLEEQGIYKATLGIDKKLQRIINLDIAPLGNINNRANAALTKSGKFLSFGETSTPDEGFSALWTSVDLVNAKAIVQRKLLGKGSFFAAQTAFGAEDAFLVLVGKQDERESGDLEFKKLAPNGKVLPLGWKSNTQRASYNQNIRSRWSLGTYALQAMPDNKHVIYFRPGRIEILSLTTGDIVWALNLEGDSENSYYDNVMPWYSTISITPDQSRFIVTSLDNSKCMSTPCPPQTKVRVFTAN